MKKKVLLIDDAEFIQRTYKNKFIMEGYDIVVAKNGIEGLKTMTSGLPDIILLDLVMPIMDGFKVLQTIKDSPALKEIPVIVFSAKGIPDEIEKAISMGATDYLVKSVTTPNVVVEKVKGILEKGR